MVDVLVVEDEKELGEVLCDFLKKRRIFDCLRKDW